MYVDFIFFRYISVYPSYAITFVYLTVIDINDNAPQWVYPVYPNIFNTDNDRAFYIGAIPLLSQYRDVPVNLMVCNPLIFLSIK